MTARHVADGRFALQSDEVEVEVLPRYGARLHSLRAFGHELLLRPERPEDHLADPFFLGAYVMAPWCNRIATGPLEVTGRTVALASNFSDGSAIHGQVHTRPWQQVGEGEFSVRAGGDGWPWPYEVRFEVATEPSTVRLRLRLRNLAESPMPGGLGLHPWFIKPVEVAINAARAFGSNSSSAPQPSPVAGDADLRRPAPMPDGLDATWTELGDPPVELRWPTARIGCRLQFEAPARYVTAASPPEVEAVAIEPQTHAPQGLRRLLNGEPGALAKLEPGEELRLAIEMSFQRYQEGVANI
jgi:aldose 1-epimerase